MAKANVEGVVGRDRPGGRGDVIWRPTVPVIRKILTSNRPGLWLLPVVIVLLFIGVYPLIYNLRNSFREYDPVRHQYKAVGFANWSKLLYDDRVHNALRVTAEYVGAALLIEFALGLVIALLLNSSVWAEGLWQSLLILPMVVPPTIAAQMFGLMENSEFGVISWFLYQLGLNKSEPLLGGQGKHALEAVLLPDVWQWTPFFVLILLAGLKALPSEPLEAAQVDGASTWQRFLHITLPMLRPMIAVAVLFRLVDLLKVFDYVYVMTSGGPGLKTEVMSFYTYRLNNQGEASARSRSRRG